MLACIVFLILLTWAAFGRTEEFYEHYCDRCGRLKQTTKTGLFIPFVDYCVIPFSSESHITNPDDVIVRCLDPDSTCSHHWVPHWYTLRGGVGAPFSAYKTPPYQGHFDAISREECQRFLDDQPETKQRLLDRLKDWHAEVRVADWLEEEYCLWKTQANP